MPPIFAPPPHPGNERFANAERVRCSEAEADATRRTYSSSVSTRLAMPKAVTPAGIPA